MGKKGKEKNKIKQKPSKSLSSNQQKKKQKFKKNQLVTQRPDIVVNGLWSVNQFQRLPKQILHQYAQKQKIFNNSVIL